MWGTQLLVLCFFSIINEISKSLLKINSINKKLKLLTMQIIKVFLLVRMR